MELESTRSVVVFSVALAVAVGFVQVLGRFAIALGLVDMPGGRKDHTHSVPLVGGLAIFAALLVAATATGISYQIGWFLFALSAIIAIGFWDDVADIPPKLKLLIEIIASAIMIWGAGIELRGVGDLLGWREIGLWIFVVPMTMFAVIGVVNAVNMMDGLDGLAGSLALVAFGWYGIVAADSGLPVQSKTALIFCAAISGFLLFNLRFPWQKHARVFLGDAGSLMLGFALGWFAIDLTQGDERTFPPIAALWVVLLPLADCVSLMTRRIRAGRSPFVADRHHIHHYLLARGFNHSQTLAILVGLSVIFGAVGYFGWYFNVPESVLFYPFLFGFFAYHFWIQRAWKAIETTVVAGR
jgi:UDP-GlcNAc:undecaprenyl-phosphate/decaprenyl-phosphate GlcNAc-1-phosphate transferase